MPSIFPRILLVGALMASAALAAPSASGVRDILGRTDIGLPSYGGRHPGEACDLSASRGLPALPDGLDMVGGETPQYVFLARGIQNYTCETNPATNVFEWIAIGALADFYDASCYISAYGSDTFTAAALAVIPYPSDDTEFSWLVAAKHVSKARNRPVFKLVSDGSPEYVGNRTQSVPAPVDPAFNVPWIKLAKISGELAGANTFYRVDTVGGQPDKITCDPATDTSTLSVDYTAYYWGYGQ